MRQNFVSKENLFRASRYLKLEEYLDPQFDYGKAYNDQPKYKRKKQIPWGGRKALSNEYQPRLRKSFKELDEFSEFTFRYQGIKGERRYGSGIIPKELYESYSKFHKAGSHRYELAYAAIFLLPINEFSALDVLRYKSDDGELIYFRLLPKKSPKEMAQHPFFSSTNTKAPQTEKRKNILGKDTKKFNLM